jgi:hypothetical protein
MREAGLRAAASGQPQAHGSVPRSRGGDTAHPGRNQYGAHCTTRARTPVPTTPDSYVTVRKRSGSGVAPGRHPHDVIPPADATQHATEKAATRPRRLALPPAGRPERPERPERKPHTALPRAVRGRVDSTPTGPGSGASADSTPRSVRRARPASPEAGAVWRSYSATAGQRHPARSSPRPRAGSGSPPRTSGRSTARPNTRGRVDPHAHAGARRRALGSALLPQRGVSRAAAQMNPSQPARPARLLRNVNDELLTRSRCSSRSWSGSRSPASSGCSPRSSASAPSRRGGRVSDYVVAVLGDVRARLRLASSTRDRSTARSGLT